MNVTPIELYFLMKLDMAVFLFIFFGCICAISCLFLIDFASKKVAAIVVIVGALMIIIGSFIPSTKQMAAIMVLPKIINNEKVQGIPDKILDLGIEWLDELKPKGEK